MMAKKKPSPRAWESWRAEFSEAARTWEGLLPRVAHVRVLDGTIYLVGGPANTKKELAALGWKYGAKGIRSMHPEPDTNSPLAKASQRLLALCKRLPSLQGVAPGELAKNLELAVEELTVELDGKPDPATHQQWDSLRNVNGHIRAIHAAIVHERADDAEKKRKSEDERRQARRVAKELHTLQGRGPAVPTAAERALQERHARQLREADTAFGLDALKLLAKLHEQAPGAWRTLSAFSGCGGHRWHAATRAKTRGKGYDYVRRALTRMVACDLVERAGPGKSKRGGFRITNEGLQALAKLTRGTGTTRTAR